MIINTIGRDKYLKSWKAIAEMKEPELELEYVRYSTTISGLTSSGKKYSKRFSIYKCTCGQLFEAYEQSVNHGVVTSCGCKASGNQSKIKKVVS